MAKGEEQDTLRVCYDMMNETCIFMVELIFVSVHYWDYIIHKYLNAIGNA